MQNKNSIASAGAIFFVVCCFVVLINAQCPTEIDGVPYANLPKLTNSGPLASKGDWVLTDSTGNIYNWNLCAEQNSCASCGLPNTVVCQSCNTGGFSCGVLSSQLITVVPGINSVNFIYNGGSFSSGCGVTRSTNISVACSSSSSSTAALTVFETDSFSCAYSILMTSPYACPTTLQVNPLVPDQAEALSDMQKNWGAQMGWEGDAASQGCKWLGVSCTSVGIYSTITEIDVSGNNLQGAIPDSIGNLRSLTVFNTSNNPLIGGSIPSSLGTIDSLTHVDLSMSGLSGKLPNNLYNLKELMLQKNKLSGDLSFSICSVPAYNLQANLWNCPLPACCSSDGNYLCVPCVNPQDGSLQIH